MIDTKGFFMDIFKHAKENSVIIMDVEGKILHVNKAFKEAFKYQDKDVTGQHFRMLFTEKDRLSEKPEREIQDVARFTSKSDNNYLVTKKGNPLWVMGESVLVSNENKERFIVKMIQDIHAQKQLESFLLESREFINVLFDSIKDASLITLDPLLKIIKTNRAFTKMFELEKKPTEGTRLNQLDNSFWKNPALKKQVFDIILNQKPMKNEIHIFKSKSGKEKRYSFTSKLFEGGEKEKLVLLVIKEEGGAGK